VAILLSQDVDQDVFVAAGRAPVGKTAEKRLRVLFLSPRIPWPLDSGGKIRTYYLLRALARHHQVRVLTFGDASETEGLRAVRELGASCERFSWPGRLGELVRKVRGLVGPVPYTIWKYQSAALRRRALELCRARAVDVVHCDHLHMATYGALCRLPYVVDQHNVEFVIWERFARDPHEPIFRRLLFWQQGLWLKQLERDLCTRASKVLVCSRVDEGNMLQLIGRAPGRETRVVPNGVDVEYFSANGPAEGPGGHLFFTGSMDWAPNQNAVLSFLDVMWPEIRRQLPGLAFYVVGRHPGPDLRARHGADGIHVTGTVADVRPYMRGAVALVVPMRVGGGTRLKILEAFAARVPVISTAVGAEGIDAEDGVHYLRAESAGEFAAAIRRLQADPALAASLTEAGYQLVEQRYSWDVVGEELARSYAERYGR
jgi:sugar transferase (PEP-CTERM/EpsH1 system associated)